MMVKNEAQVQVTGWLNDVKDFEWGRALKVSVDVRKKNHQGEWETVDKTIYDVTTDNRAPLDGVKQVVVSGRIVARMFIRSVTAPPVSQSRFGLRVWSLQLTRLWRSPVMLRSTLFGMLRLPVASTSRPRSDGELWSHPRLRYGVELLSARLPGGNERDERARMGFRVSVVFGGSHEFSET
jgi:hypothetical protein